MNKPHQRKGSLSNSQVGADFEREAQAYWRRQGLALSRGVSLEIGVEQTKKSHDFDLGDIDSKVIVECKSHTWTESGNVPSAKMTTWDQAMYYFHAAPKGFRKIMFVLSDWSEKRQETLAEYYLRTKYHMIPNDVEIWEYDTKKRIARRVESENRL